MRVYAMQEKYGSSRAILLLLLAPIKEAWYGRRHSAVASESLWSLWICSSSCLGIDLSCVEWNVKHSVLFSFTLDLHVDCTRLSLAGMCTQDPKVRDRCRDLYGPRESRRSRDRGVETEMTSLVSADADEPARRAASWQTWCKERGLESGRSL